MTAPLKPPLADASARPAGGDPAHLRWQRTGGDDRSAPEGIGNGRKAGVQRLIDILILLALAPLALPLLVILMGLVWVLDGRPVLYRAERMRSPGQAFTLHKLRTMRPGTRGVGALGGDRADEITPLGRWLRRSRLDELPQLWNILRGDMSFVGPRPPERLYVERCPELYARVLQRRPGLTGLATLVFHAREEALLGACRTAEETDDVYMRRCVPRKARLDLIWARSSTPCGDLVLLLRTVARVLRLPGATRRGRGAVPATAPPG